MGWFDRFFKNEKNASLQDNFVMKLVLQEEQYILKDTDIDFKQKLGRNGYPNAGTCAGIISCTLCGTAGKRLQAWAVYADKREDGEIRVYSTRGDNECVFSFCFSDANCLFLHVKASCTQKENTIRLVIAPHVLSIGNEELVNEWR